MNDAELKIRLEELRQKHKRRERESFILIVGSYSAALVLMALVALGLNQ